MADQKSIDDIVAEIFSLDKPKIDDSRKDGIAGLIKSTVNGDIVKKTLIVNSTLKQSRPGVLVYVLTNKRIIKTEIDPHEVQSISYPLDKIVGVERKLIDGDLSSVNINFPDDSFGLRYPAANQKISDFFQCVDQARIEGKNI